MRRKSVPPVVWAALAIPVLWAAVLAAGVYESGMNLFELMERLSEAGLHPFDLRLTAYTPRFLLAFLLLYGGAVVLYILFRQGKPQAGGGIRLRPMGQCAAAQWEICGQKLGQ